MNDFIAVAPVIIAAIRCISYGIFALREKNRIGAIAAILLSVISVAAAVSLVY